MLTTKPTPQASWSNAGSYRPSWRRGSYCKSDCMFGSVSLTPRIFADARQFDRLCDRCEQYLSKLPLAPGVGRADQFAFVSRRVAVAIATRAGGRQFAAALRMLGSVDVAPFAAQ